MYNNKCQEDSKMKKIKIEYKFELNVTQEQEMLLKRLVELFFNFICYAKPRRIKRLERFLERY